MKRRFIKWAKLTQARLRDAYRVLFRKHYFLFSTDREITDTNPNGYYDIEWRDMRRQDVYQIGVTCMGLLAEDDECQDMLDQAKDLLQ